jgi:hypothetical protein
MSSSAKADAEAPAPRHRQIATAAVEFRKLMYLSFMFKLSLLW